MYIYGFYTIIAKIVLISVSTSASSGTSQSTGAGTGACTATKLQDKMQEGRAVPDRVGTARPGHTARPRSAPKKAALGHAPGFVCTDPTAFFTE